MVCVCLGIGVSSGAALCRPFDLLHIPFSYVLMRQVKDGEEGVNRRAGLCRE